MRLYGRFVQAHPFPGHMYIYRGDLIENMRQKLITLDLTSFEIASKMSNFSGWVREQLKKYRDKDQNQLDIEDYEDESLRLRALLSSIAQKKTEWISPHGWVRCGEEE